MSEGKAMFNEAQYAMSSRICKHLEQYSGECSRTIFAGAVLLAFGATIEALSPPGEHADQLRRVAHYLNRLADNITTLTQAEIAQQRGYEGDACITCGQFMMRRAGTCLTCTSCGSTTGCG